MEKQIYAEDTYEAKYQLLISKRKITWLRHLNDSKAFIEFSNDMNDICKNIEKYNLNKRCKIMIIFDDMIADMVVNIFLVFMVQSSFAVSKNIRLNSTHYFIMKTVNKQELQQITFNNSSDIDFRDFMNLYKKCNT